MTFKHVTLDQVRRNVMLILDSPPPALGMVLIVRLVENE